MTIPLSIDICQCQCQCPGIRAGSMFSLLMGRLKIRGYLKAESGADTCPQVHLTRVLSESRPG